jgi:hypothetical protein
LARFSDVDGDVSWRRDDHAAWSQAVRNLPLRQGCEISASGSNRAELQFDDGSRLQMGRGAVVTFTTLYSDADGEFTEIAVRDGTIALRIGKAPAVYQVDTPFVSVVASGPASLRVDAVNGVQVGVRQGRCTLQRDNRKGTLVAGNYLDLQSERDSYEARSLPTHDAFDNWTAVLYSREDRFSNSPHRKYLPNNVAIVSDNLDDYGDWRSDRQYGRIWHPRVREAGWRPYHDGHWVWVDPFGWTWVSGEPWGWAPYHYGTWVDRSEGWCWAPGPSTQYWSPAVVDFYQSNDSIAWCPLAPSEVRYPPALSIGFQRGDWSMFFSIGAAAVYYPTSGGYSEPRAWSSGYVNSVTYINDSTNNTNYNGGNYAGGSRFNHNSYSGASTYMPVNARYAAGASLAQVSAFGGRGSYRSLPRNATASFSRGHFVGAPGGGFSPVAGPPAVRPTAISMTPTRSLRSGDPVSSAVLTRAVYSASPGPIMNRVAAARQTAQFRASGAAAAAGNRSSATMVNGRPLSAGSRMAQPGRAAATARQSVRQSNASGRQTPAATGRSREQSAAMHARSALGLRPGTMRSQAGARPAQSIRSAGAAAHRGSAAPIRIGSSAPRTAGRQAQFYRRTATPHSAAAVRNNTQSVHRSAASVHRNTPSVRRNMASARRSAAPVRRNAVSAVRQHAPSVRQRQAPQRQAPQRQAPQRQAPSPQGGNRSTRERDHP